MTRKTIDTMAQRRQQENEQRQQEALRETAKLFSTTDDDAKVDAIVTELTESHLEWRGGYPWAGTWVGDTFVWATVESNETDIHQMERIKMLAWWVRARKCFKKNPEMDLHECLSETHPGY